MRLCELCKVPLSRHSRETVDRYRGRRFCGTTCGHAGQAELIAKLTPDNVREIRQEIAKGETNRVLADRYGVAQATVWSIKMGRSWRHVV